ncbi:MAG: hypothetical protein A2Y95_11740 [Deltaproteobacteria bacterium RBG_13_65_10]|jgi:hypothetical protein|nr:MAG: hypothetical protein A2Y95_11740 [Deltaproteobacteria bacterium RBG_13_65_10]
MHRMLSRSLALALVLILGFAVVYALWEPARRSPLPAHAYDHNAVWARYQWFSGVRGHFDRMTSPYAGGAPQVETSEIDTFAAILRENRIHDVYIFTGSLNRDGRYPLWPLEDARAPKVLPKTFALLRERVPGIRLLAWVGGVHAGFRRGQMDLRQHDVRAATAELCARLTTEAGFDGVHLNIEPTRNNDDAYVELLADVRARLPRGKVLSVAAPRVFSRVPPFRPFRNHFWDLAYTARVAARVDQLAFMTYDTFMPFPKIHRAFLRYETKAIVRAVRMGNPHAEVLLGVPTYDDHNISHVRNVETISNTLRGIRAGLNDLRNDATPFSGVAIYASWTTDADEWSIYRALWLGQGDGVAGR